MPPIFDLRPVFAILAECRDLRRQAAGFPSCAEFARRRIRDNRRNLAAIRYNRACLRLDDAARNWARAMDSEGIGSHAALEAVRALNAACAAVAVHHREVSCV